MPMRNVIPRIPDLDKSQVRDVDSYMLCHYRHYNPFLSGLAGFFYSRGGLFKESTLFGLQYDLHKYRSEPVTEAQVEFMSDFAPKHGLPFNTEGWMRVARKHKGRPPIRIRAIPEGLIIPTGLPTFTVQSTDPELAWLQGWFETALARLWEPSTIAISSREQAKMAKHYWEKTSTNPFPGWQFQVHDFGGRGVTCREQAQIAGAAHLLSFRGSDTIEGVVMLNHYYNCAMSGFSIPATQHSIMCMDGPEGEFGIVKRFIEIELIERQLPPGVPKVAACVGDTFDIYNFTHQVTDRRGVIQPMIKGSGGKFVERPDSGNPLKVLPDVVGIAGHNLGEEVQPNQKGFKVFPGYYGLIQGDGIDIDMEQKIYEKFVEMGWSTENINFGSGGGLLQKWNRDHQKYKYATSWGEYNGVGRNVRKDPITDPTKQSIAGRLDTIRKDNGDYDYVVLEPGQISHPASVMNTVFENGDILWGTTADEVRTRMAV